MVGNLTFYWGTPHTVYAFFEMQDIAFILFLDDVLNNSCLFSYN